MDSRRGSGNVWNGSWKGSDFQKSYRFCCFFRVSGGLENLVSRGISRVWLKRRIKRSNTPKWKFGSKVRKIQENFKSGKIKTCKQKGKGLENEGIMKSRRRKFGEIFSWELNSCLAKIQFGNRTFATLKVTDCQLGYFGIGNDKLWTDLLAV